MFFTAYDLARMVCDGLLACLESDKFERANQNMNAKVMANLAALFFFAAAGVNIGLMSAQYSRGHRISLLSVALCVVFFILGSVMLRRARSLSVSAQVGKDNTP